MRYAEHPPDSIDLAKWGSRPEFVPAVMERGDGTVVS